MPGIALHARVGVDDHGSWEGSQVEIISRPDCLRVIICKKALRNCTRRRHGRNAALFTATANCLTAMRHLHCKFIPVWKARNTPGQSKSQQRQAWGPCITSRLPVQWYKGGEDMAFGLRTRQSIHLVSITALMVSLLKISSISPCPSKPVCTCASCSTNTHINTLCHILTECLCAHM